MWNNKITKPFLGIYISCLFLATFFLVPTVTSFYYYAWGKQLAWSYFDGPPMIAYFFHISHLLFGNTYFSINIVGFFCLILGAYYLFKMGELLQDKQTGFVSALIWIVLPTTTESIFVRVLYDAPLNLFTIMSFYYFARYISQKRILDLYLSAIFIGSMLLSKYTAVVSVLSLFLFVLFSKQRQLFKNNHFYFASLVIILMVSPVIYWNINHHWISITYLLNFHSQTQNNTTAFHCLMELSVALIINFSVFLVVTIMGWFKYHRNKNEINNAVLELNYALLFIGVMFWIVATLFGGDARSIYLTPLGMNFALAAGYFITQFHYQRFFKISYPVFLIYSIVVIISNSWPIATYLKKGRTYAVVQNALQNNLFKKDQPIVTGFYTNASTLNFFMPTETIHAIPCEDINQYQYWSEAFIKNLNQGKIDKITYVDFKNSKQCAENYFNHCESVSTISFSKKIPLMHKLTKPHHLYVYECSLPRKHKELSHS